MNFEEFKNLVFNVAARKGFDDCELFIKKSTVFGVGVSKGKVENYSDAVSVRISFKGLKGDKAGFSVSEKIDPQSAEFLVDSAWENLKITDSEDKELIYDGTGTYKELEPATDLFEKMSVSEKIKIARCIEQEALSYDPRIKLVMMSVYDHEKEEYYIFNTKGVQKYEAVVGGDSYVYLVASDGKAPKRGLKVKILSKPDDLDPKQLASEAASEAISQLGASSIKSGKYPVLFRRDAFASLFSAFLRMFSAEHVQKGLSPLKGKLEQRIASEIFTAVDDPFLSVSPVKRSFDDEGVPTSKKAFIEKGTLKTFFHTLKSAAKDKVSPTGNGFHIKGMPLNVHILPGDKSFDEMVRDMKTGIVVIAMDGLHSGVNPTSGDFSVSAVGYFVEDGAIKKPVEQVTISGSFLKLLSNFVEIGNDVSLEHSFMDIPMAFYTPSVLVSEIDVAGM
ncbi:MAG: TldD/PmbA family protein [Thermotogae bacterium]|nr:MAG: TldD/PmbA family protein [Thermotogota bacterium]